MKKVVGVIAVALSLSMMMSGCLMNLSSGKKSSNNASKEFKSYTDDAKKQGKDIFDASLADEKQLKKIKKSSSIMDGLGEFDDAVYYQFNRGSVKEIELTSKKVDGDDMENVFFLRASDGDDAIVAIDIFQFSDEDLAEEYFDEQCDNWSIESIGYDEPIHTGSMDVGMKEGKDYYAGIVASSSYDQAQSVFVKLDGDTVVIVLYYGTYESGYLEDFFTLLDEMDLVDMEKVMKES